LVRQHGNPTGMKRGGMKEGGLAMGCALYFKEKTKGLHGK